MKKFIVFLTAIYLNAGNLEELLNNLNENELLKAKNYKTTASMYKKDEIFDRYLPSFSIEANYINLSKDRLAVLPKSSISAAFVVQALLYDGARSSNIKLASQNYELQKLELEKSKIELELQMSKLYFTYFALLDNINYKKKNIEYLKANQNRLEKLVKVGLKPDDELRIFIAKVELESIELEQFLQEQNNILSKIYLLSNNKTTPKRGSKILDNFDKNESLDIKISIVKENMSELNKEIAFSEFLPKIYIKNITNFANSAYEFGDLEPFLKNRIKEKTVSNIFMLGFKWEIFSFGASNKNLEQAKLENLAAKQMLNYEKRKSEENIKLTKQEIKILKKEIQANENRAKASKIAFDSIDKKYKAGLLGYVEYLNALELNYAANAALSLAKSKLEVKKAELLNQLGMKISLNIEN